MKKEQIEMVIYSLSRVEYAIYNFFLNRLIEEQTLVFSGGQKSLASLIGCHENSVLNAVKSLIDKGWMKRIRNGKQYSLHFTPPEHELQYRIAYCTDINFETYYNLKVKNELEQISEKLELEYESLRQEVLLLKKKKVENAKSKKTITKEHINDFVDKLLVRLGNNLNPRSLENKVLTEIRLLKKRITTDKKENINTYETKSEPNFGSDWTPGEIHKGNKECLEFLRKKNKGN